MEISGGHVLPDKPDGDLRVEAELVARLAEKKFQGVLWERFANDLAIVGLRVIVPWIRTRQIFPELRRKGIRCRGPVGMSEGDAEDLAAETVARAIDPFRVKMLMSERWNPHGGARLSSLFITQCLYQFPNAYRDWMRSRFGSPEELPGDEKVVREAEELARDDPIRTETGHDPEATVIAREEWEELLDLLPDRLRGVIQLVVRGYSFRQAAELHGEDHESLQRQLWRLRPRLRQLREHRRSEVDP
ncbi:MAG TPA: hypothetical protein VIS06_01040 [Mycobacteriales bacterium]